MDCLLGSDHPEHFKWNISSKAVLKPGADGLFSSVTPRFATVHTPLYGGSLIIMFSVETPLLQDTFLPLSIHLVIFNSREKDLMVGFILKKSVVIENSLLLIPVVNTDEQPTSILSGINCCGPTNPNSSTDWDPSPKVKLICRFFRAVKSPKVTITYDPSAASVAITGRLSAVINVEDSIFKIGGSVVVVITVVVVVDVVVVVVVVKSGSQETVFKRNGYLAVSSLIFQL